MKRKQTRTKGEAGEELHALYRRAVDAIFKRKGSTAAGHLQKALKAIENANVSMDQSFYLTMLYPWADLFWSIDRPDLVLEVFEVIEKELPGDPQIMLHRAIAFFHLARFEEAQALLSDLEDRGYPAADLHFFLGCLAERRSREAMAMSHFERAAMLEPERYLAPEQREEKVVRDVMKNLIGGASEPLRPLLNRARLIVEPLPSDEALQETMPRLDPLALMRVDLEPPKSKSVRPRVNAIHLFKKNIEKFIANDEDLEERLSETLAHDLSLILQDDEEELRRLMTKREDA